MTSRIRRTAVAGGGLVGLAALLVASTACRRTDRAPADPRRTEPEAALIYELEVEADDDAERERLFDGKLAALRERLDDGEFDGCTIRRRGSSLIVALGCGSGERLPVAVATPAGVHRAELARCSAATIRNVESIVLRHATLEFRLVARQPYLDAAGPFLEARPRFAAGLRLRSGEDGIRYLETDGGAGTEGRALLEAFLAEAAADPQLGPSVAWTDVRLGLAPRSGPDTPPAWRTYLLEPEVLLSGDNVRDAAVRYDPDRVMDSIYVTVELDQEGAERLERATGDNVGRELAIVFDGKVRAAPRIVERIAGGQLRITLGSDLPPEDQHGEAAELERTFGQGRGGRVKLRASGKILPELLVDPELTAEARRALDRQEALRLRLRVRTGLAIDDVARAAAAAGFARARAHLEPDGVLVLLVHGFPSAAAGGPSPRLAGAEHVEARLLAGLRGSLGADAVTVQGTAEWVGPRPE